MEPLIKITTDPIRIEHFRQNGRLVNSNNVDMERRKALARQASFRNSVGQGPVSVDDINKINRTFSKKQATPQVSENGSSFQQKLISSQPQAQAQAQVQTPVSAKISADMTSAETSSSSSSAVSVTGSSAAPVQAPEVHDIAAAASSSYTAQRGAFEMRVAKGELSYLPPMVMTVVTQRPQVHIEYLGGFNYVPPRDDSGGNVNLFT